MLWKNLGEHQSFLRIEACSIQVSDAQDFRGTVLKARLQSAGRGLGMKGKVYNLSSGDGAVSAETGYCLSGQLCISKGRDERRKAKLRWPRMRIGGQERRD